MLKLLFDLFFPIQSVSGGSDTWITAEEKNEMERRLTPLLLTEPYLRKRGYHSLDALVAATKYDNDPVLKKVIVTFKYKRISALHKDLAEWMLQAMPGLLLPPQPGLVPVLCPVPLHWTRRYFRGFNQAALLAELVEKRSYFSVRHLLRRTRATGHQAHRKRDDRLTALKGAFSFQRAERSPEWVVLIDDICTTGATLDECAGVLKAAGVRHVSGLVVAYG